MKPALPLSLLTTAVLAASTSVSAVQLEDYLIANSSYEEAYLDGNFSASDVPANEQVAYNYSIAADYDKTFSTLPRSWSYSVAGFATGARNGSKNPVDADGNPVDDSSSDFGVTARGTIDTYFHESAYPQAFWFGQGEYETRDSSDDDDVSLTLGLGYGRVYNATPLAKVIRIVEELNEEGVFSGPIPDAVLIEAAEIVDREDEFKSKYGADEYRRQYYAAIEAALARSGAFADGKLGALGALTMDEVLEDEPISVRKHGWVVRAGAGFQASDLSGLSDNDPKLLLSWEYAKPYGYKGQFINLLSFEPVFGDNTVTVISNEMSYTHELSDRIDWINSWNLSYIDGEAGDGTDVSSTNHTLVSSYNYFLTNRLNFNAKLTATQSDNGGDNDDPSLDFSTGFTYRLK